MNLSPTETKNLLDATEALKEALADIYRNHISDLDKRQSVYSKTTLDAALDSVYALEDLFGQEEISGHDSYINSKQE
jgi:hypothetical protein